MNRLIGVAGGAVVVVLAILLAQRGAARSALLEAAVRDDVTVARAAGRRADSLERAFRVDTVRLTRLVDHRDSLLAATHALEDARAALAAAQAAGATVDTVRVTVPAQVLVTDDATIRACRVTLSECAVGWKAERERTAALSSEVTHLRQLLPTRTGTWFRCTVAAGSGAAGAGAIAAGERGALLAAGGAALGCLLVPR